MTNKIECPYIEINQPIGTFYVASMKWQDLIEIAKADIHQINSKDDDFAIQRERDEKRINEISQYVKFVDATFPTSIILAIKHGDISMGDNKLIIDKEKDVAKIIDGQHRIEGLKKGEPDGTFELNVTIFVDMEREDQAIVFATINKAQTKVNKSLVYDLYQFTEARNPQKTCHSVVRFLDEEDDSPFKDKIKVLGKADDKKETITQSTFVESLLGYISGNTAKALEDRDILKRGDELEQINIEESKKLIFRNLFIENQDAKIAKILLNYFNAIEKRWPQAWTDKQQGFILNRTTGFIALMQFLRPAYLSLAEDDIGRIPSENDFYKIFEKIDIKEEDLTAEKYKPGGSGPSELRNQLHEKSGIPK